MNYPEIFITKAGFVGDVDKLYESFYDKLSMHIKVNGDAACRDLFSMLLDERWHYVSQFPKPYSGNPLYVWLLKVFMDRTSPANVDLLFHDLRCLELLKATGADNDRPKLSPMKFNRMRKDMENLFLKLSELEVSVEEYARRVLVGFREYTVKFKKELPFTLSILCKPKIVDRYLMEKESV
jgi:hypothetical protein